MEARPELLREVVIPYHLSPSMFSRLLRCKLSATAASQVAESAMLLAQPGALFGTIAHHVRRSILEGRWNHEHLPIAAVEREFHLSVEDAQREIAGWANANGLLPLKESVGRRKWNNGLRELAEWAKGKSKFCGNAPRRGLVLGRNQGEEVALVPGLRFGPEAVLQSDELRLKGRPDWMGQNDKQIEIVDFKTGRTHDEYGRVVDAYRWQLHLYALMSEELFPDCEVSLFIESDRRHSVEWNAAARNDTSSHLARALEELPEGMTMDAEGLANPGTHCRECRLRAVCGKYMAVAPTWWREGPDVPRPLPLDSWGTVQSVDVETRGTVAICLEDAGRRLSRITGVAAESVEGLDVGDRVLFFDLESTEDLVQHGSIIHPRNFHVNPPGTRRKRARMVRVFAGTR